MFGKNLKQQSAMEYLMTYGWAILIIAVVLSVLFYLGVFSGSSFLPNACIASSGFLCSNPIYSRSTGTLTFTFGQMTGTNWASANVVFVPSGATLGSSSQKTQPTVGAINSGQQVSVSLPIGGTVSAGTPLTGSIYVNYTISGVSGTLVTQVATISTKAQ